MQRTPQILLLTSDHNEAATLRETIGNCTSLVHASNFPGMIARLKEDAYDVLFCSWSYYRVAWSGVLREAQGHSPDLPVIVVSRTGGEWEWVEVLEAGAFDLLAWPCRKQTALAVVEQAMASHEARRAQRSASDERPQQWAKPERWAS